MFIIHVFFECWFIARLVVAHTTVVPEDAAVSVLMVDNADFGLDDGRTE